MCSLQYVERESSARNVSFYRTLEEISSEEDPILPSKSVILPIKVFFLPIKVFFYLLELFLPIKVFFYLSKCFFTYQIIFLPLEEHIELYANNCVLNTRCTGRVTMRLLFNNFFFKLKLKSI